MHLPLRILRLATLASALAAVGAASASAAILYFQDFNSPNSATPLSSFGWSAFNGGAPSSPTVNGSGTSTGGIFNTERAAQVNLNTTNATTSWFGGLRYTYANPLPGTDLDALVLTANIYAGGSVGARGDVTLRIESSANNWIGWTVSGATLASGNGLLVGGALSSATASLGSFNPNASSFNIVVAYANTLATWGNDSSNILGVDNVRFESVAIPEPATASALFGAFAFAALSKRRRRRD